MFFFGWILDILNSIMWHLWNSHSPSPWSLLLLLVVVVVFHCYFNLQFPNDIWCWVIWLFHMIICHLYIFFGGVSIKIFCPFLSCFVCFLIVDFYEFFVYFGYKSFIRYVFCQYFLPVCGLPFYPLNFYGRVEVFNFNEVQIINFSFMDCAFGIFILVSGDSCQFDCWENKFEVTCPGSVSANSTSVFSSRAFFVCHTGGGRSGVCVCPHACACVHACKYISETTRK